MFGQQSTDLFEGVGWQEESSSNRGGGSRARDTGAFFYVCARQLCERVQKVVGLDSEATNGRAPSELCALAGGARCARSAGTKRKQELMGQGFWYGGQPMSGQHHSNLLWICRLSLVQTSQHDFV